MKKNRSALLLALGGELNTLLAASRALTATSAERFDPFLQPAAYQLAITLSAHGPAKAGQLAQWLDMDKSAISRLAKALCGNGLAQSAVDPDDGRGTLYNLTDEGRRRVEASMVIKSDAFYSRLEEWRDEELAQFIELLWKFNHANRRE